VLQREFARLPSIARESLAELQTQLLLAERVGCSDASELPGALADAEELEKMLRGMQRTLES
jgi:four helix bundle protein